MFRDEAEFTVSGGRGGDGVVHFRREKFVPRGGPDGGNGGAGGDVVLQVSPSHTTLPDWTRLGRHRAGSGQPGGGANKTGADGAGVVLPVPPGTLVVDGDTGVLLRDLAQEGAQLVVAMGGAGGRGNKAFATSTRRTPRISEPGRDGEVRRIRLELKLIADVGLVGLPNAGKSTLLSCVSSARPRVADYPFTTLEPQPGIVRLDDVRSFVMADLPGLIEGAHEGKGLGDRFLRHVERTRVLVFLVDVSDSAADEPAHALEVLEKEVGAYAPALMDRPRLVVATKMDLPGAEDGAARLAADRGGPAAAISAPTGLGLGGLTEALWAALEGCGE